MVPHPNNRFRGALLGLAIGDAVGTAAEFSPRGSFEPLTDMTGGGPFCLEPGQWTDDTAMALCLAASLCERKGFAPGDQMTRYWEWFKNGYMSCTGSCFDIGMTIVGALNRFRVTGDVFAGSTNPMSAGNGSLMRLAPIPIFYYPDEEKAGHFAVESSRVTHGAAECLDACRLFAGMLCRAFAGASKDDILMTDAGTFQGTPKVEAIAQGKYNAKQESDIRGTGYVVDCLEAALWCFRHTENFRDAVLRAANLGDDADTTAAVCGQLAGAHYGESSVPPEWLNRLAMSDTIRDFADKLRIAGNAGTFP